MSVFFFLSHWIIHSTISFKTIDSIRNYIYIYIYIYHRGVRYCYFWSGMIKMSPLLEKYRSIVLQCTFWHLRINILYNATYIHISVKVPLWWKSSLLFFCLCGVFNMLLDKPFANPLIKTIAEYLLLKTVVSQCTPRNAALNSPRVSTSQTNNQSRQGRDSYH